MAQPVYPQRRAGIQAKPLHDELVLYDAGGSAIHVLNPTAAAVWELCDGAHSLGDIAAALAVAFEVAQGEDVFGDVQRILAEFAAKGLVESAG